GKSNLKLKDTVTLIDSAKGFDTTKPKKGEGIKDFGTIYDFKLSVKNGSGAQQLLIATAAKRRKNPQTKSLLEGSLGSFALVGQGSEMVAGKGMNSAVSAARQAGASGPVAFGSLGGSMSRYNTGSHVKVESVNFLAGLGWNSLLADGKNGSILAGVFFESGFGNYNTHNSFKSRPSVQGNGDTRYFGGGVLGRYTLPVGLYAEGSLRAGKVKNEYDSKDFVNSRGEEAEYDSSVAYYGAHGGLGYLWQFRENTSLDFSSKYIWTHQNDDTVKMRSERLFLDKVNSHRWQTGARLTHEAVLRNGVVTSPYLGAAFDYEFGGRQKGTIKGTGRRWKIDSPTLKGGTGVGELGITVKPSANSPVSFDMSVQGYTGKREGVGGNLNVRYEF
ncbi:autotransporter outer membrane beta-barrel domain-containing protein, partial [Desulfovibrio sp. OttesenSCG-928-G15]|nr:autotransporter outer membrane beta-barrel domain-containing protein [Desulfovibrio sp. OttesenSCG-928-G15]